MSVLHCGQLLGVRHDSTVFVESFSSPLNDWKVTKRERKKNDCWPSNNVGIGGWPPVQFKIRSELKLAPLHMGTRDHESKIYLVHSAQKAAWNCWFKTSQSKEGVRGRTYLPPDLDKQITREHSGARSLQCQLLSIIHSTLETDPSLKRFGKPNTTLQIMNKASRL